MRVLWICNVVLPAAAVRLGLDSSPKEGWLTGVAAAIIKGKDKLGVELGVAFPVGKDRDGLCETVDVEGYSLACYGFYEDMLHPEGYEPELEGRIGRIIREFKPDLIHCFGTEYPHTLAAARTCGDRKRLLISIQGLCSEVAGVYMADLPLKVQRTMTFRDIVRRDGLRQQQEKFIRRGVHEIEAIRLAGHIAGRTAWDYEHTVKHQPGVVYHQLNETLRPVFYQGAWERERCEPYRIFMSQGDYPLKGLHYMLLALPLIQQRYPEVRLAVAGNKLAMAGSVKEWLKCSSYGRYLQQIMVRYGLTERVEFLGRLEGEQMKQEYLKSGLYVCCSALENSPNSLGEAMILGLPCVAAGIGGIPSLFVDRQDGILYQVERDEQRRENNTCSDAAGSGDGLKRVVKALVNGVFGMWEDDNRATEYSRNASYHAKITHDPEKNLRKMMEIYAEIVG